MRMAKMMYLTFTSAKKRVIKLKCMPNTAVTNAKIATKTITEHSRPHAGWI